MEFILNKLLFISKLNNLNDNLKKKENIVNKVNNDYNVNEINNNSMKVIKISVKCDVNEDKQRQCYKQLKCFWPKCRFSCKHMYYLNRHISSHLNKKRFVCEECNKQFHKISNLLHHKRSVHTNQSFICHRNNCNKSFKTYIHLKRHLITHSSVESFGCNKCDKRFKTKNGFRNHYLVHINIRTFICPQIDCNKTFKRKADLMTHQIIHSDKPFKCEECKQLFSDKNSLIFHKCSYSMKRPFKCNFKSCDKKFIKKCSLNIHKRYVHYGIKTIKCFYNNCDKSFVTSSDLKSHIRYKHSTDRPFKCNFQQCQSSFKSMTDLKRHKYKIHFKICNSINIK